MRASLRRANKPQSSSIQKGAAPAMEHAVRLIHAVCGLAGSPTLIDDVRAVLRAEAVAAAIRVRDSAPLFDWLAAELSYQGIADQVAADYMAKHGRASWRDIASRLAPRPTCPKLQSYWHFHGCRYKKSSRTCAEPQHISRCPLPSHDLRNGHLNQLAYSLFLFIRDVADGDLVGWIDDRLQAADTASEASRLTAMRAALLEPLRGIYGVSDKVLSMALSSVLLGAPATLEHWTDIGASMISIDTLVHNFLHRAGILRRFDAEHSYGVGCYRPGSCAEILEAVAGRIDARQFNATFPKTFPRFVQHAIWRYCNQSGLNVCNGHGINDDARCANLRCRARLLCDRVAVRNPTKTSAGEDGDRSDA